MRGFSGFLILMGAGSMVLHLIGFEFILMSWVDSWGETTGWIIRAAVLGLGIVLALAGRGQSAAQPSAQQGPAQGPPKSPPGA